MKCIVLIAIIASVVAHGHHGKNEWKKLDINRCKDMDTNEKVDCVVDILVSVEQRILRHRHQSEAPVQMDSAKCAKLEGAEQKMACIVAAVQAYQEWRIRAGKALADDERVDQCIAQTTASGQADCIIQIISAHQIHRRERWMAREAVKQQSADVEEAELVEQSGFKPSEHHGPHPRHIMKTCAMLTLVFIVGFAIGRRKGYYQAMRQTEQGYMPVAKAV